MIVVSNASPLITLSKVAALRVLPELFGKLIVATEVTRMPLNSRDGERSMAWVRVKLRRFCWLRSYR